MLKIWIDVKLPDKITIIYCQSLGGKAKK